MPSPNCGPCTGPVPMRLPTKKCRGERTKLSPTCVGRTSHNCETEYDHQRQIVPKPNSAQRCVRRTSHTCESEDYSRHEILPVTPCGERPEFSLTLCQAYFAQLRIRQFSSTARPACHVSAHRCGDRAGRSRSFQTYRMQYNAKRPSHSQRPANLASRVAASMRVGSMSISSTASPLREHAWRKRPTALSCCPSESHEGSTPSSSMALGKNCSPPLGRSASNSHASLPGAPAAPGRHRPDRA
mmetsp:Transcript_44138/g.89095  ORF Transcript_44138/g.89095 Transcript_44138/m.89095 type:complete len:242 (+) Transcript_44138:105-830(+)